MIKTLSPYPNPSKTAEIMSRYRPIAPKPESSSSSSMNEGSTSQKIKQSPYLRSLWSQLQARPTRTRKRGRAPIALPSSLKRHKPTTHHHVLGLCPPSPSSSSKLVNLSLQNFPPPPTTTTLPQLHLPPPPPPHLGLGLLNSATNTQNLVTLPLLPCTPPHENCPAPKFGSAKLPCREDVAAVAIDLNNNAAENNNVPEERDFLQQLLQRPANNKVIAPQPIRPIGSCINVGCISEDSATLPKPSATPKRKHEVEEEVESETLPVVISDSNNRVRMANSAYKEMVGQPECAWLESMVNGGGSGGGGGGKVVQCSKSRISGEVALHVCDSSVVPISSNGFSCWVRIEWETEQKKVSVNAFCDVLRLSCESRDYLFTWRFHTRTRETSQSSCSV